MAPPPGCQTGARPFASRVRYHTANVATLTRPRRRRRASGEPVTAPPGAVPRSALHGVPNHTKLALRVHLRLATCRNLLMRESRRSVERWGLTLPQFDVVAELGRAPREGFTFVELSRLLLVTSGNLTGIVDRLEAEGLLERREDDRDRRLVRIVLTREGRRLVDDMLPFHARDIQSMLAFMPADRLQALNELLGSLRDGLRAHAPTEPDATSPASRARRAQKRLRTGRKIL
jgi:DNA-binding MarR family transcriptional regulator